MKTYTEKSIQKELSELKDWKFINNGIEKNFKFLDYPDLRRNHSEHFQYALQKDFL